MNPPSQTAAFRSSGSVADALVHGVRLLESDPAAAAAQAREILLASPANADAFRLLGEALRLLGDDGNAEARRARGDRRVDPRSRS